MGLLDDTTQQEYYQGNDFGSYQFISLQEIIAQFEIAYVGENKIISKINKLDIQFHAMRGFQELSFDTFKSVKAQEITLSPSLQMVLPQDYVNYTKVSWVDSVGIKHLLHPASKTSNPTKSQTDSNNEFLFDTGGGIISSGDLITNGSFHGGNNGWILNEINFSTGVGGGAQTVVVSSLAATTDDPVQGYFYGFNGNAIGAYDVPQYWGIRQENIHIVSGEEYKITYTLSGYTSGSWNWHIVDENGDSTATTSRTADGIYEEIITASGTAHNYTANSMFFRNNSSSEGNVVVDNVSMVRVGDGETSKTWSNYKSATPSENQDDYQDDTYWPLEGSRYGLDPQHAQVNGSFYIDNQSGKIHFSSNISGKTVILDYISDSLGTDGEMQVHKFAEEAMYKHIAHAIISTRANVPEYVVQRFRRERFAAVRTAKLRLSNIKLEELTQILRGKSKQIKH